LRKGGVLSKNTICTNILRNPVYIGMVSNYTITDGSVSVVLRSPLDVLARGVRTEDWWS